jgi:DNA-3-methyladenine glycosylase II
MRNLSKALVHLSSDPVMEKLIGRFGPLELHPRQQDLFAEIADSIVSQQLSGKVARVIYSRFEALFPGKKVNPEFALKIDDGNMRAIGVSWAKVKYIKDLAQKTLDGTLKLHLLNKMRDEEVIEHLIQVKGIGPWTAQMILMFSLDRQDILPLNDLGIQKAFQKLYKVKMGNQNKMIKIAGKWKPYRTIACRYLWKSLDNE